MPAELIDGASIAARIRSEISAEVATLKGAGVVPKLTVVLVGDDPASTVYVAAKGKACIEVGMHEETIVLPASTTQEELMVLLDSLNADPLVHGILVQSPFPPHIDASSVIRRIDPAKDVDGFHPLNVGKLLTGDRDGFAPCTPAGIQELIRVSGIETHGAHCVVVGRSNIVGKPMAALMLQDGTAANATVTVCHRYTRDLASYTRTADILITAVGKPGLITADMVKPGAAVLDVGITRIPDATRKSGTRLTGDVDFAAVREVAGHITPVPGGVGPMTIAMLLRNTVRAAQRAAAA
ncbi:MAG: bifunctional 5,10-methylene-tetrahydrofolate dehydrogenase/5,10-methylene-tetrahydrofolate cyclohydrolase [Gemmatimonadota bacterium]|nr:bifunctional 5,10-methylene-tetrahydrofolate dehydrogenase/5,10-methylene-tetrahydrofolate cyclohydrolase [Gemmatimonadota bacterium]